MRLVSLAGEQGVAASKQLGRQHRKVAGQFMTPAVIAEFMAARAVPPCSQRIVRILDPAAGAGILAAALVEALLRPVNAPDKIEVTMYEVDRHFLPALRRLAALMRRTARERNVGLSVSVRNEDFLLSREAAERKPIADIVIANPPYFKIGAGDPRAIAHKYAVYGQPNIYGLFMAVCADLLAPSGRWCFITPRSWTNGMYFASARRHMFRSLHVDAMHFFESRTAHFTEDDILQEAMITWATASATSSADVVVSTSDGSRDLSEVELRRLPIEEVVGQDEAQMVTLPSAGQHSPWAGWHGTLGAYGLKVSTGPVVAFRATEVLRAGATAKTVPLLWMQHIKHMQIQWPISKKLEHIVANASTAWMLIPNATTVVMRRFSPKEDVRRVTAAPYIGGSLPGAMIGLENHTNYIYRPGSELSDPEARGLAALLNSPIVDSYFRSIAGNTQVNATDLRKLPLPSLSKIVAIGRLLDDSATLADGDAAVRQVLKIGHGRAAVA